MMYRSSIVQAAHDRIMGDEAAKNTLAEALRRVMLTDSYISLVDSISLGNFIEDYYKLPGDYFGDVLCSDLKALGFAILGRQGGPEAARYTSDFRQG